MTTNVFFCDKSTILQLHNVFSGSIPLGRLSKTHLHLHRPSPLYHERALNGTRGTPGDCTKKEACHSPGLRGTPDTSGP